MPVTLVGDTSENQTFTRVRSDLNYDYPYGLDLHPNSSLHQFLMGQIQIRLDDSYGVMSRRHADWNNIDRMMTTFIHLSEYERMIKRRHKRGEQAHPRTRPTSIVVPYSYATYETLMTYMTQALLSGPMFEYEGIGPEDLVKAKLLQLVINMQATRFKAMLAAHTSIGDSLKYGIGVSTFQWEQLWGYRTEDQMVEVRDEQDRYLGMHSDRVQVADLKYEGSRIVPIDPYRFYPDPNVAINNIQDAEYVAWVDLKTYFDMVDEEQNDETVFNVRYLEGTPETQRLSKYTSDMSMRKEGTTQPGIHTRHTNYHTRANIFVTLIPELWGLPGDPQLNPGGMGPEKWLFTLTNDNLITRCSRFNLNHGMYPIACAAPDYDGYSITPVSRMEMLMGLQEGMNWLYNSHIANVRKAINDMLIVDPGMIVMQDLENPGPGGFVRLRKRNWGRGIKEAVMQLPVADITRANINDSMFVMDVMQRTSGAVDAVQGIVRSGGERRSATEYQSTVQNALSRLEHIAGIIAMQYFHDTSYMMASHTQQFMSKDVFLRHTGDWPVVLQQIYGEAGTFAGPHDIAVDYDVTLKDGSVPQAQAANSQSLMQLYQIALTDPELRQAFDIVRMYARLANIMGDKNPLQFVRKGGAAPQPQFAPDEQVAGQVQAGNVIPLAQAAQQAA